MDGCESNGCFRVRALFKKAISGKSAADSLYKPSLTTVAVREVKRLESVRSAMAETKNDSGVFIAREPLINVCATRKTTKSPVHLRRKAPYDEEHLFSTDDEELDSGYTTAGPEVLELVKSLDQQTLQLNEIVLRNGNTFNWNCDSILSKSPIGSHVL